MKTFTTIGAFFFGLCFLNHISIVEAQQSTITPYPCNINIEGQTTQITKEDIVSSSLAALMYRPARSSTGKIGKDQIKELARIVGLLDETRTNPHLSFLDGDIAYWSEQGLTLSRLRLEFAARKAVLNAADRANVIIDDQGKLSWASQQIIPAVLNEMRTLEENSNVETERP